ncbi:hypothetical protein S2091_1262 [Solimicrobium silvestre]|uniref:Uncharacterized protein n=1 Tax=Solimicrobium silvestre TaxID=2099400 RepID=A0A2S9H284_9BURK|nr:hypothetical protein S2091_1262 [Solimicrobium silvestre]
MLIIIEFSIFAIALSLGYLIRRIELSVPNCNEDFIFF